MQAVQMSDSDENELVWLRQRLATAQKTLQEREKRLRYFMEEGVSDIIVRKALTSVEDVQAEVEAIVNRLQILLSKRTKIGGQRLN